MTHKKRTLSVVGLLLSLLLSAACSPTVLTSTPTMDLNPFRTEVAATVLAQVSRDLALTPSITPHPNPTATSLPTATPALTASPTVDPTSGTPTVATENHAQWVSQSVADDTIFAPGDTFTMSWRLKNTGSSTWTADYMLRYYSGDTFGASKEIIIGEEVPPGGEIEISVAMKAPAKAGSYRSDWVMSSGDRANFKEPIFLKIKVVVPVTPTATPKS